MGPVQPGEALIAYLVLIVPPVTIFLLAVACRLLFWLIFFEDEDSNSPPFLRDALACALALLIFYPLALFYLSSLALAPWVP